MKARSIPRDRPGTSSSGSRISLGCLAWRRERFRPRSRPCERSPPCTASTRKSAQDIVVDSEIELVASGPAPFAWRIPVSLARDIEATLDGERLPISIEPGGVMGTLVISRAGNHRLRIHRSTAARTEAGFETLGLPVNAMPSARVVVESPRDGEQQGELNARGGTRLQADRSLVGRLGPADRIEVRWPKPESRCGQPRRGDRRGVDLVGHQSGR